MKKIVISALAIAAMVSCSKTEVETGSDTSNAIVFGSSIEIDTKRADDATVFDNGEKIGIFGYRKDAAAPTTDFTANIFLKNVPFIYDGTKFATSDAAALWSMNKAHNFYAYFPTSLAITNGAAGTTTLLTVKSGTGIDATNDVMVAKAELPLYDGTKNTENLKFRHILSKVRFKIKKDITRVPNAVLSNVEFRLRNKMGTVNLMTGAVTNTLGIMKMSKDLTASPIPVTSITPVSVPGVWLVLPADNISAMIMTIDGKLMEVVASNSNITTQPGKITTITIIIGDGTISFTSTIDPWDEDFVNEQDWEPAPNVALEYGKAPYDIVGSLTTSVKTTYNDKFGTGTTNGAYQPDAATAYTAEPPYFQFEVARTDVYTGTGNKSWSVLQGTAADHNDNICVLNHGRGWRLPRLSEMRLIYENRAKLNASGNGFTAIAGSYWSATEVSGSNALSINFGDGTTPSSDKALTTVKVRCVREMRGPVLEYGVAPYDKIGGVVTTSTKISYNGKYGAGASNGAYQTGSSTVVYTNEPPYYKFEVATTDAYVTGGGKNWTVLQGTKPDRSDNICEMTHGEGWRLPRVSEIKLMYVNKVALNASGDGYVALAISNYWTATESYYDIAWYCEFYNDGATLMEQKTVTTGFNVRCIKELP